jgi:hypothetical protein
MLVVSAIFLRPGIWVCVALACGRSFPGNVRVMMNTVSPAIRMGRHAACQCHGQVSLNAEAAHYLPVEWIGHCLTAEWAGLIKCQGGTSLVRQRALSAINAGAAQPEGLTSGSARWLTSRAVGHVAASGPRLGGEQ